MCGICGYLSPKPITQEQLWGMTNTLEHRGPDDSGVRTLEDGGFHIGFGHRRLSVFDLSQLGHQPMVSDEGSPAVTYNGEIYNFTALRTQLEEDGFVFRSNSDTEVLLQAYKKWGADCVHKFNGMFAFALYDKAARKLILARDRIGKKPLYYYHHGQTLIFGSEMKALMKHPDFVKDIDREAIAAYMTDLCYTAPQTVFRNTYMLEPGCMLVWENGTVRKHRYWDLLSKWREGQTETVTDAVNAKAGLKERIRESVRLRLAADVPVGILLSGGIDSTLVASTAAEMSDKQVKTFTIGFHGTDRNEAGRAKKTAEYLGTDHSELYVTETDILSLTADIPKYYDVPFADSSQIPTMLVSSLARQNVTVALSGDGGDELFCGYTKYDNKSWIRVLGASVMSIKDIMSSPGISELNLDSPVKKTFQALRNNRFLRMNQQMLSAITWEVAASMIKGGNCTKADDVYRIDAPARQERAMLLDMLTELPDDQMCKVDRASMRYALELRCPLLDVDVAEYSFRIPLELKYRSGERKWILKQVAYDYVPREMLDMPKRGFSVPLAKWLTGPLRGMADKYSNKDILIKQDIFEPDTVAWLVRRLNRPDNTFVSLLWSFLMFQMWYQMYIEDLW